MSGISFTRHHRWRRIFDGNISGQSPCLHHQGIVVLLKPSRLQHTLSARTSVCVCTTLGYRTFHFTPTLPSIPSLASTAAGPTHPPWRKLHGASCLSSINKAIRQSSSPFPNPGLQTTKCRRRPTTKSHQTPRLAFNRRSLQVGVDRLVGRHRTEV
jgi:hypothetical protein